MEYFIICLVAFLTSILTFFSGFGLGTILMPVFALFFPIELAITLTGVVHLFNNVFKLIIVGQKADKIVLFKFGVPAVIAAFLGAWLLLNITELPSLYSYQLGIKEFQITPVKLIISLILIGFSIIELLPLFDRIKFSAKQLPIGGLLSGFFGGLSGHQGALRTAFLIKAGLSKEAFIGTAVVISCFVDFTRISMYATNILGKGLLENTVLVTSATFSAILGASIGHRLLKKATLKFIQKFVAICLILISLALGVGLI